MDAWKGNKSHVILSRVGGYKVFYQDVFQMGPGQELESELDAPAYKCLLGIVNDCHHCFLVAMYPSEKRCILADSLGESPAKKKMCLETTR
ncbi:unnamed protein product [Arctogadus glacialis]